MSTWYPNCWSRQWYNRPGATPFSPHCWKLPLFCPKRKLARFCHQYPHIARLPSNGRPFLRDTHLESANRNLPQVRGHHCAHSSLVTHFGRQNPHQHTLGLLLRQPNTDLHKNTHHFWPRFSPPTNFRLHKHSDLRLHQTDSAPPLTERTSTTLPETTQQATYWVLVRYCY